MYRRGSRRAGLGLPGSDARDGDTTLGRRGVVRDGPGWLGRGSERKRAASVLVRAWAKGGSGPWGRNSARGEKGKGIRFSEFCLNCFKMNFNWELKFREVVWAIQNWF